MPSSPEVWPHESPIARTSTGRGARRGLRRERPPQLWRSTPPEVSGRLEPSSRVRVRAPPHPGHRAQRATSGGATGHFTSAHTRSRFRGSRGGSPGGNRYVELERPRAWRGRDPRHHVPLLEAATPATKPALRPQPRRCRGRPRERLPPAQRLAPLLPRRTLRAPSTCRASLARVVTAP